jgi:hypothetical protein
LTALIPLRARDGSIRAHALIDAADVPLVEPWSWSLTSAGYAARGITVDGRVRQIMLHRQILGLRSGDELDGDHINRDRLDCRRENLRVLPHAGRPNSQNMTRPPKTSAYRGVSWAAKRGQWVAQVRADGRVIHLGYFGDEHDASEAARAARRRFMPYAVD